MNPPLTAIVTGASRGIGRATAARLRAEGWTVWNLSRSPPQDEPDPHFVAVELGDAVSTRDAVAAVRAHGPVTGLVNNASVVRTARLDDVTVDDLAWVLAVNVQASLLCAQAVIEDMRAAGFGRIVNISSRAHLGKVGRSSYAAAKAGMNALARVWALELAGDGITANVIAPGPVRTRQFEETNPPDAPRTKAILDAIPVGRMGEPQDIAHAVAFLMDPRSSFITGQTLYVGGGITRTRAGS